MPIGRPRLFNFLNFGAHTKRCTKCGTRKPARAFFPYGQRFPGQRRAVCKSCLTAGDRRQAAVAQRWIREYAARWRPKTRRLIATATEIVERGGQSTFRLPIYYRLRHEAILAYGGYRCACCGIREALFLTIDHVNDGGARHRRQVGASVDFFKWLKRNGYPKGFQVLCSNCNSGRHRNGGCCPHKDPVRKKK